MEYIYHATNNLRKWIKHTLLPYLKGKRLSVFLPYRDCQPGTPREDEIREMMTKSRNILIILSEVYDDIAKRWLECELKYSWLNYRCDWRKNIVIINYDLLETKNISDEFVKAFSRLGKCIDFSNFQNDIEAKMSSVINQQPAGIFINYELKNRRGRFRSKHLVQKTYSYISQDSFN